MLHDDEYVEVFKQETRNREQVYRGNAFGLIQKEGLPALSSPEGRSSEHVLRDRRLSDREAELQ